MTRISTIQFGQGLELEGFFLNHEGLPIEMIDGIPASEWTSNTIEKQFPQLRQNIGMEQASVMLEVKSDVFSDGEEAIQQILEIRAIINKILERHKTKLVFTPVAEKGFKFIPATSNPFSRTHSLIKEWSKDGEGEKKLFSTATASLQFNDSTPFRNCELDDERMELARKIHNLLSENFAALQELNQASKKSFQGKTRIEHASFLLQKAKRNQFRQHGFVKEKEIIIPPLFKTVEAMKRWMCAHSNVHDFSKADAKNEHALTCKIKRENFWAVETRGLDSVDEEKEIKLRLKAHNKLLELL